MREINPLEEVAIKYKKVKLKANTYILIPSSAIQGYSFGDEYFSNVKFKMPSTKSNVTECKYLVDGPISLEDLQIKYEMYDNEDIDFLCDYYFEEEKNNIIIVEIVNDRIKKRKISIPEIRDLLPQEVYERQLNEPSVVLNEESLQELLETEDIENLKSKLIRLKQLIEVFLEKEKQDHVARITVTNGHISSIDTDCKIVVPSKKGVKIEQENEPEPKTTPKKDSPIIEDFSVKGLEQYINERVFGQEQGVRLLAKNIYMNYTAAEGERVESMLIVGPTGTGKTATLRAAAEYLSIPFKDVNTVNLVPQGIVGESLEDCLYSLIVQAGGDIAKACRGILFFDELDKLGIDKSDQKATIKEILLKFIEGSEYSFTKDHDTFIMNTTLLTKIFAGAFTRIYENDNRIFGFTSEQRILAKEVTADEVKDLIRKKEYFGIELLDRIKIPIIYHDLDDETKKKILLESKLSEYLMKKKRYQRQFNVELIAEDSYIEAIFAAIADKRDSIRILNNMVYTTLDSAEYELCTANHRGKRLILTKDTVANPDNFTLI